MCVCTYAVSTHQRGSLKMEHPRSFERYHSGFSVEVKPKSQREIGERRPVWVSTGMESDVIKHPYVECIPAIYGTLW